MIKRVVTVIVIFLTSLSFSANGQNTSRSDFSNRVKPSPNIATGWMNLLTDLLRKDAIPPPACLRLYAYTGLALYESQVPGMRGYQSMFTYFSGNKIPAISKRLYDSPIAANIAVAEIVKKLSILKSQKEIDSLASHYKITLQRNVSREKTDASIAYGKRIADAVFEWSKTDGTFDTHSSYSVPQSPELWKPAPHSRNPPPGAYQGLLRTFVKDAVSFTFPSPPPTYSTDTNSIFYKNADAVFQARNKLQRADSLLILAWQPKYGYNYLTMSHLTKLVSLKLEKENYSLEEASIIYFKNGIAMHDAIVSSFNAIYKFNVTRPVTFIKDVMRRNSWNTFYDYNFYPSYPSNVASCIAASATIASNLFGESHSFVDSTQNSLYGSHQFSSITDFINRVTNSRVIAGIDFPFSIEAGIKQGKKIAELVNKLPIKK